MKKLKNKLTLQYRSPYCLRINTRKRMEVEIAHSIFYFSKLCRGDFCVARFWWFFLALREASWIRGGFLHARVCASPITTSHMEKST